MQGIIRTMLIIIKIGNRYAHHRQPQIRENVHWHAPAEQRQLHRRLARAFIHRAHQRLLEGSLIAFQSLSCCKVCTWVNFSNAKLMSAHSSGADH